MTAMYWFRSVAKFERGMTPPRYDFAPNVNAIVLDAQVPIVLSEAGQFVEWEVTRVNCPPADWIRANVKANQEVCEAARPLLPHPEAVAAIRMAEERLRFFGVFLKIAEEAEG